MTEQQLKIALVGAGGKMGMRVSDNLHWTSIFNDEELDHVLKQMLHLDNIDR